jgi:diketogulonate reductase-like aldo/keto reductase
MCSYSSFHLVLVLIDEITSAGLPPPSVNQLELSPFNQHKDVAQWAKEHDTVVSCGAYSKLSGGK